METDEWGDLTWTELVDAGLGRPLGHDTDGHTSTGERHPVAALLPVGAVEAHGPHLPLRTDEVIATAAARAACAGLRAHGIRPLVLPPLAYTAAPFADGFPGTISLRPETVAAIVEDIAHALDRQGVAALVIVNAHFDPAHMDALRAAVAAFQGLMPIVYPDVTKKPWALRLTDEFRSGACHAGRYETSIVQAAAPALVRDRIRAGLSDNPASLSRAIGDGVRSFEEAGVTEAYCGAPAEATPEEGNRTISVLGDIVVEAVTQCLEAIEEAE